MAQPIDVRAGTLIVLAPIKPGLSGNGLAMRTGMFLRSAPSGMVQRTVVVPVAGQTRASAWSLGEIAMVSPDASIARAGVVGLIREPSWRARLKRVEPLPSLARAASPGLGSAVVEACRGTDWTALHVMRSYLAPLGVALAERIAPKWMTLDLDDDDASVFARLGQPTEASAYARLLDEFGPLFDGISAATEIEARALASRHNLVVDHLPNAVDLPEFERPKHRNGPRIRVSLLFVGNLTYAPNIAAARLLVETILPRVASQLSCNVRLKLVGPFGPELRDLAGPNVELTGFVADLEPFYTEADVVVAPLSTGGGTRIKLLEAFAHRVPVVASSAAAEGLEVSSGRHLLIADDPDQAAGAVRTIFDDPNFAARVVEEGFDLVRRRYSSDVVIPVIRDFYARAMSRSLARHQSASP